MPITPGYKPPGYKKPKTYVVRQGDTLGGLATQFGVDATQLMGSNRGVGQLSPGVVLSIPEPPGLKQTSSSTGMVRSKQSVGTGDKYYSSSNVLAGQYQQPASVSANGGNGRDWGGIVGQDPYAIRSAPTTTNMPDTYNAQIHAPGLEYQKQRLAKFEALGTPAPTIDMDTAKVLGFNDVTLVQAGYIKQGSNWVYTNPSTPNTPTTTTTGAQGDYWQYQQDIQMGQQNYSSAKRRNMKEMLSYKEAKENDPTITRRIWMMRKSGHGKGTYSNTYTEEEETGTPAVQTYTNTNYSSTGRSYATSMGLISWRM
jgi:LysM repeat protein